MMMIDDDDDNVLKDVRKIKQGDCVFMYGGPCTKGPTVLWSIFGHIWGCGLMTEETLVMQIVVNAYK